MKEKKININGLRELLLVGVVLLLCVVWTVMNPQFLSVNNITNILRQASYTAIAAVGMTMIIIIGEIDLSAGSLVCAAGLVGAVVCKNTNNVLLAILAAKLFAKSHTGKAQIDFSFAYIRSFLIPVS